MFESNLETPSKWKKINMNAQQWLFMLCYQHDITRTRSVSVCLLFLISYWCFPLSVILWKPVSKDVEVERHQMLPPTNTTSVLSGCRQSTSVNWCWFGFQIEFTAKRRRQVLFLRINAGNRAAKDSFLMKSKELWGELCQVSCLPVEAVAVCWSVTSKLPSAQ